MKKIGTSNLLQVTAGDVDAACGFAVGFGFVALISSGPLAPATGGFIAATVGTFCGGAILSRIHVK